MKVNITKRIEQILKKYPKTRNSDLELYILFFQKYVCNNWIEKIIIRKIFERWGANIAWLTRKRAFIQNNLWQYLSDKQVKKMRE